MNWRRIAAPLVAAALFFAGWQWGAWGGVALVATALVMVALLYLNRMVQVLRRAADQPKGYTGSAVMLNAKLKRGVNLLHVIALTQSIGDPVSPEGEQPEFFRWTDGTGSSVTGEFADGRLVKWQLSRPNADPAAPTGK